MRGFVSGLFKVAFTVGLLAGVTHLLHREWFVPTAESIPAEPTPAPIPTPRPVIVKPPVAPAVVTPLREAVARPTPAVAPRVSAYDQARAELMELTEKKDVAGLQAFVARYQGNRDVSDWVYAAQERLPLFEQEQEVEAVQMVPGRLRDAFGKRDMAAVRRLIPELDGTEAAAIGAMLDKCKSVELTWGRGGAYLQRGKPVAEINQELEVRVVTENGEALRARKNWVKVDVEKVGGEWVVRRARWHRGSKGNFSAFDMPELP